MQNIITFAQDNILWVLLGLTIVAVAIRIIKSFVKWVVLILAVGAFIYFGNVYEKPDLNISDKVIQSMVTVEQRTAIRQLMNASNSVAYKQTGNTYTIVAGGITLKGSETSDKVTLTIAGEPIEIKNTAELKEYVKTIRDKYNTQSQGK